MTNETYNECFHFGQWQRFDTLSPTLYILLLLVNILSFLPAVILNIVICVTIFTTASLNTVPSMIIIGNMALSDLIVGLVAQPIYITWLTMDHTKQETMNSNYCAVSVAFGVSSTFFAGVSLLTITVSSIDRFLALRLHLRYNSLVTPKAAFYTCVALWIFALLIACSWIALDFLAFSYFVVSSMSVCISATIVFYGVIFKTLRRHQRQIIAQEEASHAQVEGTNSGNNSSCSLLRFRKTLIGAFAVYAAFLVCYLPLLVVLVLYVWHGSATRQIVIAIKVAVSVVFINSAINPVLFLWRVSDLRESCRVTMSKCLCSS